MGTSRFENFKPMEFDDIQSFKPDFTGIAQHLGGLQNEYDTGLDEINNRTFKNLAADDPRAQEKRIEQQQMIDNLTETYAQDIGAGRAALAQSQRDIASDYNPGGEAYSMQKNLEAFQAWDKEQGELAKKGTITTEAHELARQRVLNNFAQINGTTEGEYGYNTIDTIDINAYVNRWDTAEKIGKDWSATIFENWDPEKGEKASVWLGSDGFINTKNERIRKTIQDDMMAGILRGMFDDDKLQSYETQIENLKTGKNNDYTQWQYRDPDTAEVKWDLTNPFVKTAWDVMKKHTVDEHSVKRGKTRDPLYVAQQKRAWGKQDEEDLLAYQAVQSYTSNGNVNTHPVTSQADITNRINNSTEKLTRLENSLDAAKDNPDVSHEQIQQLKRQIADEVSVRDAYTKLKQEAIETIAPEVIELGEKEDAAIRDLMKYAQHMSYDEIKDIAASIRAKADERSMFSVTSFDASALLREALGIKGPNEGGDWDAYVNSNKWWSFSRDKKRALDKKADKINDFYAENDNANDFAPSQISLSPHSEVGSKAGGTLRLTEMGAVNQATNGLSNDLMFSDPNGHATYESGDDFKAKIEAQYEDSKFEWNKGKLDQYIKYSTLDENGQPVEHKKAIMIIPYTNATGSKRNYRATIHLDNAASGNISGLVEASILKHGGKTGENYINYANAQHTDAGASFKIAGPNGTGGKIAVKTIRREGEHSRANNWITWRRVKVDQANTEYLVDYPTRKGVRYNSEEEAIESTNAYNNMVWEVGSDGKHYTDSDDYVKRSDKARAMIANGFKTDEVKKLFNLHK